MLYCTMGGLLMQQASVKLILIEYYSRLVNTNPFIKTINTFKYFVKATAGTELKSYKIRQVEKYLAINFYLLLKTDFFGT